MLNSQRGISLLESLLAISIVFMIAGLLLPKFSEMSIEIERQKVQAHASEAAYNGARLVRDYDKENGVFIIDDIHFYWYFNSNQLCVSYLYDEEAVEKCILASD